MNLPPRSDGEHWCIGDLVRLEALRMREYTTYLRGDQHLDAEAHLAALEARIWQWLLTGWTRLREDGVLVHWHPGAETWVPFTRNLHSVYTRIWEDTRVYLGHRFDQAKAGALHAALLAETDGEPVQ